MDEWRGPALPDDASILSFLIQYVGVCPHLHKAQLLRGALELERHS